VTHFPATTYDYDIPTSRVVGGEVDVTGDKDGKLMISAFDPDGRLLCRRTTVEGVAALLVCVPLRSLATEKALNL
jgi:hypothetical protein